MSIKAKSFLMRFVKGFIASGIASSLAVLNSGVVISSLEDLKYFGVALIVSFITGGLLATEKMLTWEKRGE